MHRKTRVYLTTLFIVSVAAAQAGECPDSVTALFSQSRAAIVASYQGNDMRLESFIDSIESITHRTPWLQISAIRVAGSASPEGSPTFNLKLSERRAEALLNYFITRTGISDSLATVSFTGADWSGLRSLVEFDTRVPYRAEVLVLLDEAIDGRDKLTYAESAASLRRLRALRNGVPYKYIYTNVFPYLRSATLTVNYSGEEPKPVEIKPVQASGIYTVTDDSEIDIDTVEVASETITAVEEPSERKPFYMALKTNMLYDAAALPSVGAEFYLGKNWSVGANWTYGWWDKNSAHRYWRAYGGDITVRRWFGHQADEKPLTGHHVGVYGGVGTFDFEWGGTGYMGGKPGGTLWDKCMVFGGVEYGYSLPVSNRLNIDFTLGIGYMSGKYYKYKPQDGRYVWQSTHRLNWFGPTKAEVSLVWLIGRGNYNNK